MSLSDRPTWTTWSNGAFVTSYDMIPDAFLSNVGGAFSHALLNPLLTVASILTFVMPAEPTTITAEFIPSS